MTFRNERFNASLVSLDEFTDGFEDPSKITAFTDRGEGVERMLEQIEPTPDTSPDPPPESECSPSRRIEAIRPD